MNLAKQIPNTITCLNLISGIIAIVCSFEEQFDYAVIAIIIAAIFDFMDGLAARVLNAYSEIGKELDSLADLVSFGVAPSLIAFNYLNGFPNIPTYSCFIIMVMAALSAVRLAKFNLDTRQTENFLGLPVPANALFVSSSIALINHYHPKYNAHQNYLDTQTPSEFLDKDFDFYDEVGDLRKTASIDKASNSIKIYFSKLQGKQWLESVNAMKPKLLTAISASSPSKAAMQVSWIDISASAVYPSRPY